MLKLKFFGLGGQGIVTAAKTLSVAVSLGEDKFAVTVPAYGHERRGAPVYTSIIVDDEPVLLNSFVYDPDIVLVTDVCIADRQIDVGAGIKPDSVLVLNTDSAQIAQHYRDTFGFCRVYYVDGTRIALQCIGRGIPNSAMLGALCHTGIVRIESVEQAVLDTFGGKAGEQNARAAKQAWQNTASL
ncbi:MAG: 2-oxoacid:acceptor oxidoreductase family protein [Oscillospiraceae bacterium]|jgi:2-oxoacid:acceptor oxidoreductase gamma subunit (pyruvate/2-ketoisovalerate family)|nr:2-oxoacid:acceptor oxidoreductase family protein [Oscillospiraceae bacterium]